MISKLSSLKVSDAFDSEQELVVLKENATIGEALGLLYTEKISSVPLVDSFDQATAFIDVLDIVAFLYFMDSSGDRPLEEDDFMTLYYKEMKFSKTKVASVANLSSRNRFEPIRDDMSLLEAILKFGQGIHRLPVYRKGKMINVFTQSQFLKFLHKHPELIDDIGNKTCQELGLGTTEEKGQEIIKVSFEQTALEALRMMQEHNLSALAVVDKEGHLFCQISAGDLKGLSTSQNDSEFTLRTLSLPIKKFIEVVRKVNHLKKNFIVWITPSTSFYKLIDHMVHNSVHRVYLIDNYTNLCGIISITDIAKLLSKKN